MVLPCDWVAEPCGQDCTDLLVSLPVEARAAVEAWAVDYLWKATGRRYGLCETTYRPCAASCGSWWDGLPYPDRIAGEWVNLTCNRCQPASSCSCGGIIPEITLDNVEAVTGLTIDGIVYDPAVTVAVYDRRRVIRTDGQLWPACQNLTLPGDSDGAWQITVQTGRPVPPGGGIVAGILACEFGKACAGDTGCRLPQRVQTVTRQGVTIGFQDTFETLDGLKVGIFEVDAWVAANRTDKWQAPRVLSPDRPRPAVRTWPAP